MTAMERYEQWLSHTKGALRTELCEISGNEAEISRRFSTEQEFGTAGIRCVMGAGSSLLNDYTVRRVARGLARYMVGQGATPRCAIGYDSRNHSERFARVSAAAIAAEGVAVYLYDRLAPTPMLSFAVRELSCGTGMMITASHNTKEYNGLKCYGADGCQMTEEPAAAVAAEISKIDYFEPERASFETLLAAGKIAYIPNGLWAAYYERILRESLHPERIREAALSVVYSPLCGAGGEPVTEMLTRLGAAVFVPESQKNPSGEFETCPNPNPENASAFDESFRLARTVLPDLLLATDPDCDRIAAEIPQQDGFQRISGNEMGCLLLDYILSAMEQRGTLPKQPEAVMSIVSSPIAAKVAESHGCRMRIVPTGFKYIGAVIRELEEQNRAESFVFGFEESCGYLKGTYCRDKDAVLTALLIAEMTAYYKLCGRTLADAVDALYATYGYVCATLQNVVFTAPAVQESCLQKLEGIKKSPPREVAGYPVLAATDFSMGVRTVLADGRTETLEFPRENMARLEFEDGSRVILRPSGTEPKMKLYYTATGASKHAAEKTAAALQAGMTALLDL